MNKILSTEQAIKLVTKLQNQTLVLVGGCFDILHVGHISFLKNAKQQGDALMVLLEHDAVIKKRKGEHRPLNKQKDRAEILASLEMVDYVVTLPEETTDEFYDNLVIQLKPAIIATTAGDPYRSHKERQAEQVDAKVVDVIKPVTNKSTTKIIDILNEI